MDLDSETQRESFEAHDLTKRACKNNGCKCKVRTPQGQYCGRCSAVTDRGTNGWYTRDIFECNPEGGCCTYGLNTDCAGNNWKNFCPE